MGLGPGTHTRDGLVVASCGLNLAIAGVAYVRRKGESACERCESAPGEKERSMDSVSPWSGWVSLLLPPSPLHPRAHTHPTGYTVDRAARHTKLAGCVPHKARRMCGREGTAVLLSPRFEVCYKAHGAERCSDLQHLPHPIPQGGYAEKAPRVQHRKQAGGGKMGEV